MTTPDKDQVLETPADAPTAGSPEPAAPAEAVEAEVIEEAETAPDAEADPADELAQAKAEAADWQDKYLRLHAEWDTYRRRTNEQRAQEKARATEKLVESTIDYATTNGESGLLGGVEAVHSKLVSVLEKDGVEVISPEGQAFDALEAQAVATVDDPSVPDETVAQVYQKGYRMGAKVLRPAMVTVTTGGPKREVEETSAE